MPALANPRWERFALALFAGLDGKTRLERAHSTAYLVAYPNCKPGNSAEAAASQLLRRIKPITDRVRELQAEQSAKIQKKIDLSKERIGRRLNLASEMAEQQQNPAAIVNSELGIAKVFHKIDAPDPNQVDFTTAHSMQDIGRKLLQSVGFASPDDVSIQAAISANDRFIEELQQIHQRAQALTFDHAGR
jgi:tetrahydromethanopterin S-methyltransferase subunit G